MDETLKKIHLRMKDLDKIRRNNFYVVYNLRKLLKNYQSEFKKKESLEALKRMEILKIWYLSIPKEKNMMQKQKNIGN